MQCKPSQLPDNIFFVRGGAGRWIFNDGRNVIIVTQRPKKGVVEEGDVKMECKIDFLFYERGLGMWMHSEQLRIMLGDLLLFLPSGEPYFQMIKAAKFGDWHAFWKIYAAESAKACKAEGQKVKGFKPDEWAKISADVMVEVARLKLACPDVFNCFKALVNTCIENSFELNRGCRFTECSPKDKLYGIGMNVSEAAEMLLTADVDAVFDPDFFLGGGNNLLGKAYDSAFDTFFRCGGYQCENPSALAGRYEQVYGKDFFESFLQVEDEKDESNKKPKVADDSKTLKTDEQTTDADMGLADHAMAAEDLRSPSAPIARCLSGRTGSE